MSQFHQTSPNERRKKRINNNNNNNNCSNYESEEMERRVIDQIINDFSRLSYDSSNNNSNNDFNNNKNKYKNENNINNDYNNNFNKKSNNRNSMASTLTNDLLSEIEATIRNSAHPMDSYQMEPHNLQSDRWSRSNLTKKRDLKNKFNNRYSMADYPINDDSNPEIITKKTNQHLEYQQEVAIR
jgi:hypothetical protein